MTFFLISIQGTAIASTDLWRDPQLSPKQCSHVNAMESRRLAGGQRDPTENCEPMCEKITIQHAATQIYSIGFGSTRMWIMLMMVRAQMLTRSTVQDQWGTTKCWKTQNTFLPDYLTVKEFLLVIVNLSSLFFFVKFSKPCQDGIYLGNRGSNGSVTEQITHQKSWDAF